MWLCGITTPSSLDKTQQNRAFDASGRDQLSRLESVTLSEELLNSLRRSSVDVGSGVLVLWKPLQRHRSSLR